MTFQIDTSGVFHCPDSRFMACDGAIYWEKLPPFTQGYIEAMLNPADDATRTYQVGAVQVHQHPAGFSDLDPTAVGQIMADCEAIAAKRGDNYLPNEDAVNAGRVAWVDRQNGDLLYCYGEFGPLTVFLNDARKVCLRPTSAPDAPPLHPAQIKGESR